MISVVLAAKILELTIKPGLYKAYPRTDDFMTITRLPKQKNTLERYDFYSLFFNLPDTHNCPRAGHENKIYNISKACVGV